MNNQTRQIFVNAFNYLVGQTRFMAGLAGTNRDKPGVHAAQLARARANALEARGLWKELRGAGVTIARRNPAGA